MALFEKEPANGNSCPMKGGCCGGPWVWVIVILIVAVIGYFLWA